MGGMRGENMGGMGGMDGMMDSRVARIAGVAHLAAGVGKLLLRWRWRMRRGGWTRAVKREDAEADVHDAVAEAAEVARAFVEWGDMDVVAALEDQLSTVAWLASTASLTG